MANKTDRWSKWERLPEKMKRHFHVCRCGRGWFDLTKTRPPRGVKSVKFIGRRRRNGRPAIDLICRADLIVAHHKPNLIFDIFPGKKNQTVFHQKIYSEASTAAYSLCLICIRYDVDATVSSSEFDSNRPLLRSDFAFKESKRCIISRAFLHFLALSAKSAYIFNLVVKPA